jgi:Ca2+-binding EF-hand superfamily protein
MMEQMHGMMRGGMMGGGLRYALRNFDSDNDGTLTPEEFRAGLQGELTTYDADGDGTLSLAEFETLHAAHTRTMMVRGFQMLDEDGDGKVTEAETTAVADMQQHMARGRGAVAIPDADRPGNGMMDDN